MLTTVLLFLGIAIECLSCIGLFIMPTAYARLHYLSPATSLGALLIGVAILLKEGFNQQGIKTIVVILLLILMGPILTHATARTIHIRTHKRKT
ncbi:cation:proton antiporter [Legionella oakridgensis]|uniref:Multisubunit Na+/H+ antiporter MrpG n=2 Tax=Legionella oakridgensis TaxID=29423 RepID=W0B9L2_9GAMM|nr:monovalent cation/H(+) antiporter subunit G [Legionella oakridgensis]AHE67233.1 multisubunit Na+/H+ antiporter MrpG [Legionella oakridgensis ATCC 33761 = DSM 21215]ETO93196.1 multisubunit Na+/H+ antiporter, MnhG subunit [Legionella oakridgensis RV-2-2007]KTD37969.1 putative monovalent cation/H+ antiporter subunit G [Legionella oakridgensis]STY20310.1 putative monovalent cation/H+ antiporter subunit G [Legionella longbeachae]